MSELRKTVEDSLCALRNQIHGGVRRATGSPASVDNNAPSWQRRLIEEFEQVRHDWVRSKSADLFEESAVNIVDLADGVFAAIPADESDNGSAVLAGRFNAKEFLDEMSRIGMTVIVSNGGASIMHSNLQAPLKFAMSEYLPIKTVKLCCRKASKALGTKVIVRQSNPVVVECRERQVQSER